MHDAAHARKERGIAAGGDIQRPRVDLFNLKTQLDQVRAACTHTIPQDLATKLVKELHIGLYIVSIEPDTFVLDEYARLAIRCWAQSRAQARYRRIQIVARGVKFGMGPQLHGDRLAVDRGIHTQRKPLGKRCRLFAAPHLIRNGKAVALGTKRAKHTHLDMSDRIDGINLTRLKQTLALALKVIAQRISRQLAHRELLANPGSRLAQAVHRKARK